MKKRYLNLGVAAVLAFSLVGTSCIGSFSLTNKLLSWNRQVGNKFVNELVFFAFWVLPVYEVSALADILVLNSIEFWSGDNPVARNTKTRIEGENGHQYLVERDRKGYTITDLTQEGLSMRLDYDKATDSWSLTSGGVTTTLLTFIDDTHVALPAPDGTTVVVETSQKGLLSYSLMAGEALMAQR